MEDNRKGAVNRVPFQENMRVAVLSPTYDTYAGPQYGYGAADGTLPDNSCGFAPDGSEVSDETFRSRDERGKGRK